MFCMNCGKEIREEDRFCQYCGFDRAENENATINTENKISKNVEKNGIGTKIGIVVLLIGVICMLAFITAPAHRSEAAPVGVIMMILGVVFLVINKKQ